ncbi:MAG: hypothetical protein OHK0023_24000 [Anaerolineae bacterium]
MRPIIVAKLLDYLNGSLDLRSLAQWAEDSIATLADRRGMPETDELIELLSTISAGESPYFPLTWEKITEILGHLGAKVTVAIKRT